MCPIPGVIIQMRFSVQDSGRMMEDWVYEFGQWNGVRGPRLCVAVALPHDMPRSRWCFSTSSQKNYPAAL